VGGVGGDAIGLVLYVDDLGFGADGELDVYDDGAGDFDGALFGDAEASGDVADGVAAGAEGGEGVLAIVSGGSALFASGAAQLDQGVGDEGPGGVGDGAA